MQVYDDRFQAESGWNGSSILTLLGSGHHKPVTSNLPQKYTFVTLIIDMTFVRVCTQVEEIFASE